MTADLSRAIERCLEGADRRALARAARGLSAAYRDAADRPTALMDEPARLAYLATRLPATLAALAFVATEAARRLDLSRAARIVELGAGPGPARWAFADVAPALRDVHQVDRDAGLLRLGRRLAEAVEPDAPSVGITQQVADLASLDRVPAGDLVVLSYALGELPADTRPLVVERAWQAASVALVIVEPGTVPGFARVIEARRQAVAAGGHVAAPCPHDGPCPMTAPDWCHVPVRLPRSRVHQQVKDASRGFEDEKIAYVVIGRGEATRPATARLVEAPALHAGHVELRLCTRDGLERRVRSRREGEAYRRARRARWGGALDG